MRELSTQVQSNKYTFTALKEFYRGSRTGFEREGIVGFQMQVLASGTSKTKYKKVMKSAKEFTDYTKQLDRTMLKNIRLSMRKEQK